MVTIMFPVNASIINGKLIRINTQDQNMISTYNNSDIE